jgi:hypothetical protein
MSQKISKTVFKALADKIRENPAALQNLTFADASSSVTAVKTRDLRLDVHKNTQDPNMATGIIQANSEAKDKTVKAFIKGMTGSHRGTHQVIGQKIRFGLGYNFNVNEVAAAVENPDSDPWEGSSSQGGAGASESGVGGSSSSEWVWWDDEGIWHRQINGVDEWSAPESDADSDWIYSIRQRKYFIKYANGAVLWQ